MEKLYTAGKEEEMGETAVNGLIAGLPAGLVMAISLALTGISTGTQPLVTLGYFDPRRAGGWLSGLLGHLAVAAIYGLIYALLMRVGERIRPSFSRVSWLWGMVYGLVLYGLAVGIVFRAAPSPVAQIAGWQLAAAHLLYGLVLGIWQQKNR